MRTFRRAWYRRAMLCAAVVTLPAAGCFDVSYASHALLGQLRIQVQARPIEQVLDSGKLTETQRERLTQLLEIRDYAGNVLGLNVGSNYTTYYDSGSDPISYNLTASRKDSFTPYVWDFPVVGSTPYLGFFDLDYARQYQDDLVEKGWDTVIYPVEAYSTLGRFVDPITTTMLDRSEPVLTDLIIHELTHNTVWTDADTDFDENAATFVARVGARAYLTQKYGPTSDALQDLQDRYHDLDLYNGFLSGLRAELDVLYATDLTREEKIAEREGIFESARQRFGDEILPQMIARDQFDWVLDFKFNNAWILLNARYNRDLGVFEDAYNAVDGDFARFLDLLKQAADSVDPIAFLRAAAT